jgi:hypothetical protein
MPVPGQKNTKSKKAKRAFAHVEESMKARGEPDEAVYAAANAAATRVTRAAKKPKKNKAEGRRP